MPYIETWYEFYLIIDTTSKIQYQSSSTDQVVIQYLVVVGSVVYVQALHYFSENTSTHQLFRESVSLQDSKVPKLFQYNQRLNTHVYNYYKNLLRGCYLKSSLLDMTQLKTAARCQTFSQLDCFIVVISQNQLIDL